MPQTQIIIFAQTHHHNYCMLHNRTPHFKLKHNNLLLYRIKFQRTDTDTNSHPSSIIYRQPSQIREQPFQKQSLLKTNQKSSQKILRKADQPNQKLIDSKSALSFESFNSLKMRQLKKNNQSMRLDEMFFCFSCFSYVFGVERHRHCPVCRDPIAEGDHVRAWEKLELLVELARRLRYKQWQMEQLYQQVIRGQFNKIYAVKPIDGGQMDLSGLENAFAFTYQKLLKGIIRNGQPYLFCR